MGVATDLVIGLVCLLMVVVWVALLFRKLGGQRDAKPAGASEQFAWWKFATLCLLAITFGLAAYWTYPPSDHPGPLRAGFIVRFPVSSDQVNDAHERCAASRAHPSALSCQEEMLLLGNRPQLKGLSLAESHERDGVRLLIEPEFGPYPYKPAPLVISIDLPFGAHSASCEQAPQYPTVVYQPSNSAHETSVTRPPPLKLDCAIKPTAQGRAVLDINGFVPSDMGAYRSGTVNVFLRIPDGSRKGVGWRETHSKVLVNFPDCYADDPLLLPPSLSTNKNTAPKHASSYFTVYYNIPEIDNLSWPDPQPKILEDLTLRGDPSFGPYNGAHWTYQCNSLTSQIPPPAIASKEGVDQEDSLRTFIAGAFAALASAALLEAFGEAASSLDTRRAARLRFG